ncbi:hypothetical protein C8J55DRAFT_440494 [Lentinula edodes]|uniref:Uncharacterized protein n=1 Tax=Lentinula lateritia TaxID=40482 RepID=A0A9W8ZUB4_9AGAR|nr:hypothetical protein C8J55DRAFT_440494 [Lentinula edodes]
MNLKDYFETLFPSAPAPTWFQQAFTFLNHDLGAEYCRLMQLWIRFEQLSNWRVSKSRLSDLNRPAMLNDWSKRRTGSVPALSTATLVYRFGESVWTWWCSLQPPWRTYSITNNRPTPLELLVPGNGWHSLNKGGKNGLMLIVTCLKWWREGLESLSEVEKRELETDWYLAVEDISRMLEGLIVYLTK